MDKSTVQDFFVNSENAETIEGRSFHLHSIVIRATATLGRHPGDDLVWVHDVAGFAVDAVGEVHRYLFRAGHIRSIDHLVHLGGTEMLAWIAVLDGATRVANVGIVDHEVHRLIVVMLRS